MGCSSDSISVIASLRWNILRRFSQTMITAAVTNKKLSQGWASGNMGFIIWKWYKTAGLPFVLYLYQLTVLVAAAACQNNWSTAGLSLQVGDYKKLVRFFISLDMAHLISHPAGQSKIRQSEI